LAIVEEEADETIYWLELLVEAKIVPNTRVTEGMKETNEIVAMTVASIKTLRGPKCPANFRTFRQSKIQNYKFAELESYTN
jgi:hypothetical protein